MSSKSDVDIKEIGDNQDDGPDSKDTFLGTQDTSVVQMLQEDEDVQEDERGTTGCRHNVKKYLSLGLFGLILVLAIGGIFLVNSVKSPDNSSSDSSSSKSDNPESLKISVTSKPSDGHCVHHTPQTYADLLPDNIDAFCVPEYIPEGIKDGMTQCADSSRMFIKNMCLCDAKSQCKLKLEGLPSNHDTLQKNGCFVCRNESHCPCQNNGNCKPCNRQDTQLQCVCPEGTSGSFCTKITKRICHPITHLDAVKTFEDCETSNNQSCLSREYSSDLVCELTENYHGFANCSKEKIGGPERRSDNGNTKDQVQESKNNIALSTSLLFGLIALVSVLLIIHRLCRLRGGCLM